MEWKAINSINKCRNDSGFRQIRRLSLFLGPIVALFLFNVPRAGRRVAIMQLNDSHFHLTNVQEGVGIREFLGMMGDKAGRVALFGVPLQQEWSYRVDGDRAPSYYLHSDAPLCHPHSRTRRLPWCTRP